MHRLFRALLLLSFWVYANEPKICLSLVVYNHESTIYPCLESVCGIADCVSVCDLGSTDQSVEKIERFLQEKKIPGKVYSSQERADAIYIAKKTIEDFGYSLSDFYCLTMEPDQFLVLQSEFKKEDLREDLYQIPEKVSLLGYCTYKPHFFRASSFWSESELTAHPSIKLNTVIIGDVEKGDTELEQIVQSRSDPFILGEANLALGRYDKAITQFKKVQNDPEEVWLSKYKLGICYENKKEWDQALYWYLEAYEQFPKRADPLRNIATYYRRQGQNEIAYMFAKQGSQIKPSMEQNLFPFPPLYDYQFNEELSIVAFYTRFKNEGFDAVNDLVLQKNLPGYVKEQAYRNIHFYIEPLKHVHYEKILANLPLIEEGFDERYHPMNPSIVKNVSGYTVICRAVNYTQTGAKVFHTIDSHGIYRTRNFILNYSLDFKLLSEREIIEDLPRVRRSFLVEGLEDCRLFEYEKQLCFTSSSWNTHNSNVPQISFCRLETEPLEDVHFIEALIPLFGPDIDQCEKNWLPFVKDNQLHLIYSYDPFTIYQPDLDTGISTTFFSYKPERDFSRFRGGAAPIAYDNGYLLLVHEVSYLENSYRCYLHRFVYLNRDFTIEKVSKPFIFNHFGVEFCCSMTLDHTGEKLILGIGIEDREALLGFIDLQHVNNLLDPI